MTRRSPPGIEGDNGKVVVYARERVGRTTTMVVYGLADRAPSMAAVALSVPALDKVIRRLLGIRIALDKKVSGSPSPELTALVLECKQHIGRKWWIAITGDTTRSSGTPSRPRKIRLPVRGSLR